MLASEMISITCLIVPSTGNGHTYDPKRHRVTMMSIKHCVGCSAWQVWPVVELLSHLPLVLAMGGDILN